MKKMISVVLLLAIVLSIGTVCHADSSNFDLMLEGMNEADLNALKQAIDQKLANLATTDNAGTQTSGESPALDFLYASNGETVVIRAYKGNAPIVNIPEEIEGAKVTTIAENAFKDNEAITSVSFPGTIEVIGEAAFLNCKQLRHVEFPKDRVPSLFIDENGFSYCDIQNTLVLQADSLRIGESAFSGNYNLPTVIVLGNEIVFEDTPFNGCKAIKQVYVDPNAATSFERHFLNSKDGCVFESMESLEEVYLPADCAFLTENTFVKSPYAVVYAEEGAPVLELAKSLWIPTNSADYDTNSSVFITYLENNGYTGDGSKTEAAQPELEAATDAEEAEEPETQSSTKSDSSALEQALATANALETARQEAFDYIDKWKP